MPVAEDHRGQRHVAAARGHHDSRRAACQRGRLFQTDTRRDRIGFEEDFVLVVRAGHPLASDPSLKRYCDAQHLVVSLTGDPRGFVDDVLARKNLTRRVALTVPNFMFALAVVAESDLVCAVPRRFAAMHAPRFGVMALDAPLPLGRFELSLVVPRAALTDAGVAWLAALVERASAPSTPARARSTSAARRRAADGR